MSYSPVHYILNPNKVVTPSIQSQAVKNMIADQAKVAKTKAIAENTSDVYSWMCIATITVVIAAYVVYPMINIF